MMDHSSRYCLAAPQQQPPTDTDTTQDFFPSDVIDSTEVKQSTVLVLEMPFIEIRDENLLCVHCA